MKIKASLHLHTHEDAEDNYFIDYDYKGLINELHKNNFGIAAITGHKKIIFNEEIRKYAAEKGILLMPGVELSIKNGIFKYHVIVLNCDLEAENIDTMEKLKSYKEKKGNDIFILAAHPNFKLESMGIKELKKNIDVIDGIEHSWFYSENFNLNSASKDIALEYDKPFIATSDAHFLKYLDTGYIEADIDNKDIGVFFNALKSKKFTNICRPKSGIELIMHFLMLEYYNLIIKWIT